MRHWLIVMLLALGAGRAWSQSHSLTVNGVSTGATMTQGDTVSWQITLPLGTVSMNELWIDVNANGRADTATDKLLFAFSQQDGASGNDAPGDLDGSANGMISTAFPAGLVPVHWVFVATSSAGSDTSAFTVLAVPSPVNIISGQVTGPVGFDRQYLLVEADPQTASENMDIFWQGLTDANGNYTINVGGTPAARNPWRVRISDFDQLAGYIVSPNDTSIDLGGPNPTVNFQVIAGTVLTGIVTESPGGSPIEHASPHVHPSADPSGNSTYGANTGADGRYSFAVPAGTWLLHFTADGYHDQWWNGRSSSGSADIITLTTQDSINGLNGSLVKVGEIRGTVRSSGSPVHADVYVETQGAGFTMSTQTRDDGSYSFGLDQGTYYVRFVYSGDTLYYDQKTVPPGDAIVINGTETHGNIDANFTATSVAEVGLTPDDFGLRQNYPNPFNPTTEIVFDLPSATHVRVAVYSLLGQQVAELLNGVRPAGRHGVAFDASRLPSGIYVCRMEAAHRAFVIRMALVR